MALKNGSIKKILIRSVNWLGDAVMTTPALSMIRATFPNAEITILANSIVAELFIAHPAIDRVVRFEQKKGYRGLLSKLALANKIREQKFDMAILLPNSFSSAIEPWIAGIPHRLGKDSDGRSLLLTDKYRQPDKKWSGHEVDYYINLVESFGISGERKLPHLAITEDENSAAGERLSTAGISDKDFLVGINPGATFGSAKRWYPEKFAEVASSLIEKHSARIIIFGSKAEKPMADEIEKRLSSESVLNLAGGTTVRELMAIIARCKLFVTNDSGPMHIASAFGVPLVAVFGPTDHKGTAPVSDNAVIVRKDVECSPCKLRECPKDHRCMTVVDSNDVVAGVEKLLNYTKSY